MRTTVDRLTVRAKTLLTSWPEMLTMNPPGTGGTGPGARRILDWSCSADWPTVAHLAAGIGALVIVGISTKGLVSKANRATDGRPRHR